MNINLEILPSEEAKFISDYVIPLTSNKNRISIPYFRF